MGEQAGDLRQISLETTPNEELPSLLNIWLQLVDVLQVQFLVFVSLIISTAIGRESERSLRLWL